jgi:hypothetical protein
MFKHSFVGWEDSVRLQTILACGLGIAALAVASAAVAGPLYLTSEPSSVMPAEPVLGDQEFGRPVFDTPGEIALDERGPSNRRNAVNVRDGVTAPVPEPGSLLLLGAGLAAAAVIRRRRRASEVD